jgi:hypothetical protein
MAASWTRAMAASWTRGERPTLEERVAYLEAKFGEYSGSIAELRDAIRSLDQRVDAKIDRLDTKIDRQFLWTIGIQMTVFLEVIGTLLRGYGR